MKVTILKTFYSKSQGRIVQPGERIDCDVNTALAIKGAQLGEVEDITATTKDLPIRKIHRKVKRVKGKKVETAAREIEKK